MLVKGEGKIEKDWKKAISDSYKKNITDEFIKPTMLFEDKEDVLIKENDVVIFFNFRSDRPRQITSAFMDDKFNEFNTSKIKGLK